MDTMTPHPSGQGKIVSARAAVSRIRKGSTVATGGFVGIGFPENIAVALEALYLENQAQELPPLGRPGRPDPGVCRRPGRWQDPRAQPPGP
jgi:propionate CoA-transferase